MIKLIELENSEPYKELLKLYKSASEANQKNIEAICISSYNKNTKEVNSRFVNLKYINKDKWVFYSNYESSKALDFLNHDQISASIFWNQTNVQVRLKGNIYLVSPEESDKHFKTRTFEKNILAISSNQSNPITSYEEVKKNYQDTFDLLQNKSFIKRPEYWGGYYIKPYCIELWEGHNSRLNKRREYKKIKSNWTLSILQP